MGLAAAIQKAVQNVTDIPGIGEDVTLRTVTLGSYNTTTGVIAESTSDTTVKAVMEEIRASEVNELIQADDRKCMIAAGAVSSAPSTADRVVVGSVNHQIIRVETIKQAGIALSYKLILRA